MWDLERENCIAQLNLPTVSGSGDAAAPPAVDHIAASCSSPLLYAADTSGTGAAAAGACSCRKSCLRLLARCAAGAGCVALCLMAQLLRVHLLTSFISCFPPACLPASAVRIFDLRSSELVGSVQHVRSRLAGGRALWRAGGRQLVLVMQRAA